MATLWLTTSPPVRYFRLPEGPAPSGGLHLRNLGGEELSADEDWLLRHELSAEEGRAEVQAAGRESLAQLGGALRQLWQVGRQVVVAETGQDPEEALRAARAAGQEQLRTLEHEAEAPVQDLARGLTAEATRLRDTFQALGAELAATLDTDEGRAALAHLGRRLSAFAEKPSTSAGEGEE